MEYLVTAAYADVVSSEGPQVYETTVEADSTEAAEIAAQEQCYADNHGSEEPESAEDYMLMDVFARPARSEYERALDRIGTLVAYWALGRDPTEADATFLDQFAEAAPNSSIPEAASNVADSIREETPA